jgi:ankyrin repeat protein
MSPSAAAPSGQESAKENVAGANLKVVVSFPDFCQLVRHGKLKQLKEALANVPDRKFDALTVMQPFAAGVGTVYDDLLEKSVFHINKGDENGNSPLLLAAQNNNLKVAQLLLAKGANPNHQNVSLGASPRSPSA